MKSELGLTYWITQYGNTLTFTGDNTFTSVPITLTGTPQLGRTSALLYFPHGDNVLIESIALQLPFQYSIAEIPPPTVRLGWLEKGGANSGDVTEFGANGEFQVPDFNQPWEVNNFINMPSAVASGIPWGFRVLGVSGLWANQINAPASLNASTQACRLMLKIRHTLAMVS